MGSRKVGKPSKTSPKNPSKLNSKSLFKKKNNNNNTKEEKRNQPFNDGSKKKKKQKKHRDNADDSNAENVISQKGQSDDSSRRPPTPSEQLSFFLDQYQSANSIKLSSLELESINDTCILELTSGSDQDTETLSKEIKVAFGPSWKEVLCEKNLVEGKVDPGSPAVLVVSTSAIRSIEILRGFRSLTKECHAAKLFSKHIKVEEQVTLLKNRVNIAGGTPSRLKKLIDVEALGLSRLSVLVIDMHVDVKGYSLLSLPQVRDEFWDLYKNFLHQRLVDGNMRMCLFGPIQSSTRPPCKRKVSDE